MTVALEDGGIAPTREFPHIQNSRSAVQRCVLADLQMLPCPAGWTSMISRETVQGLSASGGTGKGLPSWQQFAEQAGNAKGPFLEIAPFLFVGRILEAPAAAVYVLEEKGVAKGLLISSSAASEE